MATCIAIICIGEKYKDEFTKLFKPSIVNYVEMHGYHLKIFDSFLDSTRQHKDTISFQKCLIASDPSMQEYEKVVILDADILIEQNAPPIPDVGDKIGIVNEASFVAYDKLAGFATDPTQYYSLCGFSLTTDKILNTGMMICNPKKHGLFLKEIYDKYIFNCQGHPRGFHYEQTCIGYELQTQEMFTCVSTSWNCIFIQYYIANLRCTSGFFIHFAGFSGRLKEGMDQYRLSRHGFKNSIRWGINKQR